MKLSVFITCIIIVLSCTKHKSGDSSEWVNAMVAQTKDINCGTPVLVFDEDSLKVRVITGKQSLIYVTRGLPGEYNVLGKKISVQIIQPDDFKACLTLGPNYPEIKVVMVRAR